MPIWKKDALMAMVMMLTFGVVVELLPDKSVPPAAAAGVVVDNGEPSQLSYIDDPETGVRCYYFERFVKNHTLSCVQVRKGAEEILGAIELADRKRQEKQP